MIRAYDEYGNIIDLVEWENQIRKTAIDDLVKGANEMAIEVDTGTYTMKAIGIGLLEHIAEQLKLGASNGNL